MIHKVPPFPFRVDKKKKIGYCIRWGEVVNHPLLFGSYSYRLDPKSRVAIPARFREIWKLTEGSEVVVIPWIAPPHLKIYTLEGWEGFQRRIQKEIPEPQQRKAVEFLFRSQAYVVTVDHQGRILLPTPLREKGGFNGDLTLVGGGDHIQIWDKSAFEREMTSAMEMVKLKPELLVSLELVE
jgi:MraZ protein